MQSIRQLQVIHSFGAMSSMLATDFSNLEEAITYGNKASSSTVQRFGAQPSIPYKQELN